MRKNGTAPDLALLELTYEHVWRAESIKRSGAHHLVPIFEIDFGMKPTPIARTAYVIYDTHTCIDTGIDTGTSTVLKTAREAGSWPGVDAGNPFEPYRYVVFFS